jgi:hypothetical protein
MNDSIFIIFLQAVEVKAPENLAKMYAKAKTIKINDEGNLIAVESHQVVPLRSKRNAPKSAKYVNPDSESDTGPSPAKKAKTPSKQSYKEGSPIYGSDDDDFVGGTPKSKKAPQKLQKSPDFFDSPDKDDSKCFRDENLKRKVDLNKTRQQEKCPAEVKGFTAERTLLVARGQFGRQ